jgi:hypothetical protein
MGSDEVEQQPVERNLWRELRPHVLGIGVLLLIGFAYGAWERSQRSATSQIVEASSFDNKVLQVHIVPGRQGLPQRLLVVEAPKVLTQESYYFKTSRAFPSHSRNGDELVLDGQSYEVLYEANLPRSISFLGKGHNRMKLIDHTAQTYLLEDAFGVYFDTEMIPQAVLDSFNRGQSRTVVIDPDGSASIHVMYVSISRTAYAKDPSKKGY